MSAVEKVSLVFPHLSAWWDESVALVFCKHRQCLVEVDPITLGVLAGDDEMAGHPVVSANVALLSDVSQHLPSLTIPSGYAADLNPLLGMPDEQAFSKYLLVYKNQKLACYIDFTLESIELEAEIKWFKKELDSILNDFVDTSALAKHHFIWDLSLQMTERGVRWQMFSQDAVIAEDMPKEWVMPVFLDVLFTQFYRASNLQFAFHGAAVNFFGKNWLLAAPSGKGKSTLSSYLLTNGGRMFSDELIGLDAQRNLLPAPFPITLKTGSWGLLDSEMQEVSPFVWGRNDGRQLKYFKNTALATSDLNDPIVLVFPEFSPDVPERVARVNACEALKFLALSGYELLDGVSEEQVEALLRWLEEIDSLQIRYHDCSHVPKLLEEFDIKG